VGAAPRKRTCAEWKVELALPSTSPAVPNVQVPVVSVATGVEPAPRGVGERWRRVDKSRDLPQPTAAGGPFDPMYPMERFWLPRLWSMVKFQSCA